MADVYLLLVEELSLLVLVNLSATNAVPWKACSSYREDYML
jgi:hypothetical protein